MDWKPSTPRSEWSTFLRQIRPLIVGGLCAAGSPSLATPPAVIDLDAGANHNCVLFDHGKVKCWGSSANGQLGYEDDYTRGDEANEMGSNLAYVDIGPIQATAISTGMSHTCIIGDDRQARCWGSNDYGQLGLGRSDAAWGDTPEEMGLFLPSINVGTDLHVVQLSAGGFHTCALLNNGSVKCWGTNSSGQLGIDRENAGLDSSTMGDALPAVNLGAGVQVQQISAGTYHTCALSTDGRIKCWGSNGSGQLGIESYDTKGVDPATMGDALPFVNLGSGVSALEIAAGGYHTCARLDDNGVKCWGNNDYGQLANGSYTYVGGDPGSMGDANAPIDLGSTLVSGRLSRFFGSHQCLTTQWSSVKCWGQPYNGQLGYEDYRNRGGDASTIGDGNGFVHLPPLTPVTKVVGGVLHTCTLGLGKVYCFGDADNGQTGYEHEADIGTLPGTMGETMQPVELL